MATAEPGTSQTRYERTDKSGARRKALFPADVDVGSDLGHMSPIHSECSNFSEHDADQRFRKFFQCNLDDYVLLDDEEAEHLTPDPCSESGVPTLYLSPLHSLLSTPILYSPMHATPHDTSTVKVNQKHAKRKLDDHDDDDDGGVESPGGKQPKVECKSRVRTTLFPEEEAIVLPAASFYPKTAQRTSCDPRQPAKANGGASRPPRVRRMRVKRLAPAGNRRRHGEINAGVRHKVRKPKAKTVKPPKEEVVVEENKENVAAVAQLIFSPTAQMCDMASALHLDSPKRARLDISKLLDEGAPPAKLFPLFYAHKDAPKEAKRVALPPKRMRALADNQLRIDAGQARFGAATCAECALVYDVGDPTDEAIHRAHHDAIDAFRFSGWKNERVVSRVDAETRIVKIIPSDSRAWWKKALEVVAHCDRELGACDGASLAEKSQMYLYVKNKKIVGCLAAEMQQSAHKRLPTADLDVDVCSEEAYGVRCGISRIWVAARQRRAGVATRLVDALRRNFLHGYILDLHEIALSAPTALGQRFAARYFRTDSFLIYMP